MGLELGAPWLVLLADNPESGITEVIYKDNFTGAGFRRLISARRDEPGSYAAVLAKYDFLVREQDGRLFDPIEITRGRYFGTDADRAYNALKLANALMAQSPEFTEAKKRASRTQLVWWLLLPAVFLLLGWLGSE